MDTATSAKDRASIAGFEVIKTASIAAYNGQAASGSGQLLVAAVDPVHCAMRTLNSVEVDVKSGGVTQYVAVRAGAMAILTSLKREYRIVPAFQASLATVKKWTAG